MSLATVSNILG